MDVSANRKELIEKLRNNANALDRFGTSNLQSDLLNFRPSLEEAWTIQEHLVHLLDSLITRFLRIREAIANPGSEALSGFALESWQERFEHLEQSAEDTVGAFKRINLITYKLLKGIENQDWSTFFTYHTTRGKITLDDHLRSFANHLDFHIELIERNEKSWREKNG